VAGEGELAAAAEGDSVDGGDGGFATVFDLGEDLLAALGDGEAGDGVGGDEAANVGAGGEGARAGAGEDDGADGGVGGERSEGLLEVVEHLGVEGVQDVGAVEGDGGDGGGLFEEEGHLGLDSENSKSNGKNFDAEFAKGAEFRKVEQATASAKYGGLSATAQKRASGRDDNLLGDAIESDSNSNGRRCENLAPSRRYNQRYGQGNYNCGGDRYG